MTNLTIRGALAALLIAPLALTACSRQRPQVDQARGVAQSDADDAPRRHRRRRRRPFRCCPAGPGKTNGPVYAVKVDNTTKAHPQVGVSKADVVYIEQVEGGVTRLAAVYSSTYPKLVGPVRSARITDIDLLRQYGTVGLIYSGSNRRRCCRG